MKYVSKTSDFRLISNISDILNKNWAIYWEILKQSVYGIFVHFISQTAPMFSIEKNIPAAKPEDHWS